MFQNPRTDKLSNLTIQIPLNIVIQQKVCDDFVSFSACTDCLSRIRIALSRSDPNTTHIFTSPIIFAHKFQNFQRQQVIFIQIIHTHKKGSICRTRNGLMHFQRIFTSTIETNRVNFEVIKKTTFQVLYLIYFYYSNYTY